MASKVFLFLAIGLVAYSVASPVPGDNDLEHIRVTRAAAAKPKEGVVFHFKHKKTGINVQIQLQEKDEFREICLRIFHDKFASAIVKPCIGIKHKKNEDGLSSLPYRLRLGRVSLYSGEIKLNRKLTTCKTIDLLGIVNERVCFKNFKFTTTQHKKHGKTTQLCIKLGLKNLGKSFEVCGWFKGKKLVDKKVSHGAYNPQEMDTIEESPVEMIEE